MNPSLPPSRSALSAQSEATRLLRSSPLVMSAAAVQNAGRMAMLRAQRNADIIKRELLPKFINVGGKWANGQGVIHQR